jgi:hypothetical protein
MNVLSQEGTASFIWKTYNLLEDKKNKAIVSWSKCGEFIVIKDIPIFIKEVLPAYFRHNNLNSFVRQLNSYNFCKQRSKSTDQLYHHKLFKRGRQDLLPLIKKKHSKQYLKDLQSNTPIEREFINNYLLEEINEEANAKIYSLEAQINQLFNQNRSLTSMVSKKEKAEEVLKNAYYQNFGSKTSFQSHQSSLVSLDSGTPPLMINKFKYFCDIPNNTELLKPATPETQTIFEESYDNKILKNSTLLDPFLYYDEQESSILCKRRYEPDEEEEIFYDDECNYSHNHKGAPKQFCYREAGKNGESLLNLSLLSFNYKTKCTS